MKTFAIAAALAALVGVPGAIAPAAAQHTVVTRTTVNHAGPVHRGVHSRRVCSTHWRHHHRVRTCRVVRYR